MNSCINISYDAETGDISGLSLRKKHGYIMTHISIDGETYHYSLHRLIYELFGEGDFEKIDHINGNKEDNRLSNLRSCTQEQNHWNSKPWNKLGVKGVRYQRGKYHARVQVGGTGIFLGVYDNVEDASNAYDGWCLFNLPLELATFARLNYLGRCLPTEVELNIERKKWIDQT